MESMLSPKKRLEKIELIDTLLEFAADIVGDLKRAQGRPDDRREKELLALLFQILSLLHAVRGGNDSVAAANPDPDRLARELAKELQADVIELDRRTARGDRRQRSLAVESDRRLAFSDRRKSAAQGS